MNPFKEIIQNSKNKREIDKLDGLFREEENQCLEMEKLDKSVLETIPTDFIDNLRSTISSIEKNIYTSLVASFLITIDGSLSGTEIIKQIESLIEKWSIKVSPKAPKGITQAEYIEFINELQEFSEKYSTDLKIGKETGLSFFDVMKKIEETFKKTTHEERLSQIRNRISDFINKTKQAKKIMLSTNFTLISPFDFENFVANLFNTMGYETEVTNKTGDYGIDVIAKKEGEIIAIQCKKYQEGNHVSNREVQRLLGSMQLKDLKANKGILITTSDFTKQAYFQAEDTPIELWNKETLHETVKKYLI